MTQGAYPYGRRNPAVMTVGRRTPAFVRQTARPTCDSGVGTGSPGVRVLVRTPRVHGSEAASGDAENTCSHLKKGVLHSANGTEHGIKQHAADALPLNGSRRDRSLRPHEKEFFFVHRSERQDAHVRRL